MNSLWTTCLLTLPLVFASDLPTSSYIIEKTNCPESGYFYQDAEDARTCFLCFCQNSTAACWQRERIRCGEEIHQIADPPSGNRLRRSPVGLSDIFFRDATRDFFQKQLPQQCKPHEGSFSDGCPPADWCVGCTVCDCDANGRWDCHILSFCNGEEKKKQRKVPLPKSKPTRRVYHMKKANPKNHVTPKPPKKGVKKSIPKPKQAQKNYKNNRKQNNNVKKPNNNNKKPNNNNKKPNNNNKKPNNNNKKPNNYKRPHKNVKRQSIGKKPVNNNRKIIQKPKPRPIQRKPQPKAKPRPKPKPTTRKPHRKRYMVKKAPKKPIITTTKRATTTAATKNILRTRITTSTNKPSDEIYDEEYITKHLESDKGLESELGPESKLGRKIVSKMMGTVQRMLGKQMEKLRAQKSRVERSIGDCKKKNKKKLNDLMLRKKKLKNRKMPRINNNSVRMKREALDLDLSVIELNDTNLINDTQDFSVKRITENITEFDVVSKITYLDQNNLNKYDANAKDSNFVGLITNLSNLSNLTKNGMNPNASNKHLRDNATNNLTTENTPTKKLSNSTAVNQYYKYSLDRNSSAATVTTKMVTTMLTNNKSNSTMNPLVKNKTTIKNKTGKTATTEFVLIGNNPEFNDLKYKKWERMKILRDNIIQVNQISKYNKLNTGLNEYSIDNSLFKRLRNINHKENITRKFGVINKHNLKKIIGNNLETDSTSSISTTLKPINFNRNMSSLQALLQTLMKTLSNSTTTPSKLRTKFSLFKYLRSIFQNIFSRKKGKHFIDHKTNEAMTLQILCENVGACYLNKHNRLTLRNKLHDLNTETEKIFKTIKIIKGLLYLIVLPVIKDNSTTKIPVKDQIQKLDAILRGTYGEDSNLTQTQAAQINYVKDNMQQFGESVGKFAAILDEILKVLYKNNKKYSCQRNLRFFSKKKKLNAFNKIKNLLFKYNIVQNTFMKRMYKLLTDVEKNMTTDKPKPKVSDRDLNKTHVIDRYSTNIIQNLRKLKELAQALSSSRRKRQTMGQDEAFQYLLILMEYLLQKNHPLDTPVNDGIDLLIEAIQNAPDIKTIKKKVLDELSTTQTATRTYPSNLRYFNENSNSDSKIMSKEDSKNTEEETTPMVYYKRFYENDNSTDFVSTEYSSTKTSDKTKVVTEEKVGFDKFESVIGDRKKYEVFNTDLEDEPIPTVVVNTTDEIESTTIQNEQTTDVPSHDFKLDEDPVRLSKTKLVWIEENFDKEIKDYRQEDLFNITMHTTVPTIKTIPKSVDNISSITLEVEEEKKKKNKVADDVMQRKQIEFLNSLDYGTERSEFEDSDLKDDEKFSGDSPSYFVK